jgi:hypothetical protein
MSFFKSPSAASENFMKNTLIATGILILASVSLFAQERTIINDTAASSMLIGRHKLSLQWISWDYFGTATVTQRAGVLSVKGEQRGHGQSSKDFVTVEGMIVSVDKNQFVMKGTIITRISHINGGKPCERHGDFTFKITGKRKYWRLQEMDNPCDEATDYVDIYFR